MGGGFVMRGHYLVCKELWRTGYPNTKIKRKQREKLQLKHIVLLDFHIPFGYVWFPENTKERKKMQRKMIFLCLVVL